MTGSGKSTFAARLGARTGLPVVLVDELTWQPGWVPVAEEEQRRVFAEIVAGDRWVLDSAYGLWLDVVLPQADLVVGLDYPRWLSLQRLVRRSLARVVDRRTVCNGNTESWRDLLSSDSIVAWHFRSFTRKRNRMRAWAEAGDGPEVLLFSRPRHLDAWLRSQGPS